MPSVQDSLVGQTLGHYRIAEKIGVGGMGEVYRARDEHLARDVAIKVLPPGTLTDESARKHFHKEALILSQLNHPNIATIYDFDTQQGVDFLVMEYIPGITLSEKVAARPLPEKEGLRLGVQLAEGLAAAHDHGVVHRDLKPSNLRITSDGRLKILDFGLAKLRLPVTASAATESVSETQAMVGTLPYMAPEQLLGGEIDARTDIHAAGLVLYEMATGQRPFAEVERSQLIGAILRRSPVPLAVLNPELSPELERIIGKCLEKEPENRYQSAKELAIDLRRLLTPSAVEVAEVSVGGRKLWKVLLPAAVILVAAAIAGTFYFRSRQTTTRLTQKDTIVLADFANSTGDPVFDGTLRQGLSSQLEQSPLLNLLSDERIARTLSLMAQPREARLTPYLASQVCQRTDAAATIEGSISSLGSQYVLGIRAVNCRNGDLLAQEQVSANGKEQVLKALGEAATKMRQKLGESLASVQKYDASPDSVTTSSLEALKAYSLGLKSGDILAASAFYRRAITLDANFAMAYGRLGTAYLLLGEGKRGDESIRKAYELRDRVSEREKFYLASSYEYQLIGDLEAARKTFEMWQETYPSDSVPSTRLGNLYSTIGDHEKALASDQESLRLDTESALIYANLVGDYLNLNRLDEAKATAREAQARHLDSPSTHRELYLVAFLQHDAAGMEREAAALMGKPGSENVVLYLESNTAAFVGQFAKARELARRAASSAERADEKETAVRYQAASALREALVGNVVMAKRQAKAALALSNGRRVERFSALALGLAGDTAQATRLAADLAQRYPKRTVMQSIHLPTIHAVVALQSGKSKGPDEAIKALAAASPYELGRTFFIDTAMYPVYVRGKAYLAAHQGHAAVTEYQKILDHPAVVQNDLIGALAHLQLGRAHALQGDTAKARAAYQDFLALWKDADPDIPILKEAKAEYVKLR